MKKFIILLCAITLVCVSCSDEKSGTSSTDGNALVSDDMGKDVNIAENDLPFGATMIDLISDRGGVPVSISYEKRFMTEDEAKKISDYISAMNNCDAELMKNTCYPPYLDYIVNQYEDTDIQGYLDSIHSDIVSSYTDGEFDFNYIIVNSLMDEDDDDDSTSFSILDNRIREQSPDAQITSRKMVGIDVLYSLENDGGSYSLTARTGSDMILYIYTIDGEIYIL
ncbi:MAG: hypothetical protein K2G14_03945 [Ruminococcus sp.]|nr:hypothetical protein [Ruminococcus sp.]